MRWVLRYRALLIFLATLVFCSVMVVRQISTNQSRHVELREAFILLHSRGYTKEALRLFHHLVDRIGHLPNKALLDDFQRTMMLVDPTTQHPENLIWQYHWTVSNELEKRSERTLQRALELAGP